MYQMEEVKEKEGQAFAKEIGGLYKMTSAKIGKGIDELFKLIGQKLLDPSFQDTSAMNNDEKKQNQNKKRIKLLKKEKDDKKKCC